MPVSGTTDASQAKDRQYAQLSRNMEQLATSMEETAELFGLLQDDLRAMSVLSANHAAQFMAMGEILQRQVEEDASDASQ